MALNDCRLPSDLGNWPVVKMLRIVLHGLAVGFLVADHLLLEPAKNVSLHLVFLHNTKAYSMYAPGVYLLG